MNKKNSAKKAVKSTNLIIIDASGSMQTKESEVKGGLKQLLTDIKNDALNDKKAEISTIVVDFSSGGDFQVLVNTKDSKDLDVTLGENYSTRGMTALYDAIGKGFQLAGDEKNVFVTIITDGQENDSKEFDSTAVTKLMDKHKKKGWALTFMGTTETAIQQAKSWGIAAGNTMVFADSTRGVTASLTATANARKAYYNMTSGTSGSAGASGMAGVSGSATYKSKAGKDVFTTADNLLQSQVEQDVLDDQK